MNTLWMSLLGLILLALVLVIVANFVQGRRARTQGLLRDEPADAKAEPASAPNPMSRPGGYSIDATQDEPDLRIEDRMEPTLGAAADGADAGRATGRIEPGLGGEREAITEVGTDDADAERPLLDTRLDCIVELSTATPFGAERLAAVASGLRRAGSKPMLLEVDAGGGRWIAPRAGVPFRRLRLGVLLANRHGPLNAMEFSEFGNAVELLANQLGADADLPAMAPVLEHARALDDACMQLDAQIGLTVETPSAPSPAELAALAASLDLVERGNNRYALLGEQGEILFSLALGDQANQLALLLDVPRVPRSQQAWNRMLDCARQCAARTRGKVVDDAGRPLTDAAAQTVSRQLELRYRSLDEAGLAAGSAVALRVFN